MRENAGAANRDLVVMGASAGGVGALPRVLSQLPADVPASIAIVQHIAPSSPGHLVEILQRSSRLPVTWAEHGDEILRGRVLVAPPGVHMLVAGSRIALTGGPRENRSRPSINRLFRSAARYFGGRVIGVLLTGSLDDGVGGLAAIRASGGTTLVQDPAEADFPSMPQAAVDADAADAVAPLDELGARIAVLARQSAPVPRASEETQREAELDTEAIARPEAFAGYEQTAITCPECGGPMWEVGEGAVKTFRCFLGHAQTALTMLADHTSAVERSLWAAVRALQDRALTLEKLARDATGMGRPRSAAQYADRAREARAQAEQAREFLVDLQRRLDAAATPIE